MQNENEIKIDVRDRLLRGWENSMELTRDFEIYSKELTNNREIQKVFERFAEDEGIHASKFRELLLAHYN